MAERALPFTPPTRCYHETVVLHTRSRACCGVYGDATSAPPARFLTQSPLPITAEDPLELGTGADFGRSEVMRGLARRGHASQRRAGERRYSPAAHPPLDRTPHQ